jgi:uncharacterized protein YciI
VEYFFYGRGRPGTEVLLEELAEAHWSFMDGYAEQMIARGPTLTLDRTTWTSSMHIVDLPDAQAARVFAFQEPFYRAGVYGEVLVRRWRNTLGRTMWDYPAQPGDDRRFLVIARAKPGLPTWALEQKAAANRQVIDIMRRRLAAGEEMAWMYQEPGLAGAPSRGRRGPRRRAPSSSHVMAALVRRRSPSLWRHSAASGSSTKSRRWPACWASRARTSPGVA